ncbi:hypothetical protein [Pseudonocardia lacus]|uniref:hypothetical protein n=1 Tax=Pseudonocardia lacus TaxID=2835865 RepID=UPI001BDBCE6D|nr:hypothetical protein [Pseudonocardia lacus]
MSSPIRGPLLAVPALVVALLAAVLLGPVPAAAAPAAGTATDVVSGVEATVVPAPARDALPLITELTATACPELPPVWVVAQVQAESGWDAGLTADRSGDRAGLLQLDQRTWTAAGGAPWPADPPPPGSEVTTAASHLRVGIGWTCANLRAVSAHLEETGKPTAPLDAMLVCHIAGCDRVTGSATGVPEPGEAECPRRCAQVVHRYLAAVHANLDRFAAATPVPAAPAPDPAAVAAVTRGPADPTAWTGGATGCTRSDPTGGDCLTGATRHGFDEVADAFGGWEDGPSIRSAGCWDAHAWNPRSDHPRGRACDLFAGEQGRFAKGEDLDDGWRVAGWLRANADALEVKYLIWQGRYWDPGVRDQDGWGRRYTGGGVYDVRDATGGHYDHVHVSFRE